MTQKQHTYTDHISLSQFAIQGDLNGVENILALKPDTAHIERALICAVQELQLPCVHRLLLAIQTPPHQALLEAIRANSKVCFELLAPHFDLNDHKALCFAAGLGRLEVVKIIAPHCEVADNDSEALWRAAQQGHASCVAYLLEKSHPKDYGQAFTWAVLNDKRACVELILPHVERPQHILDHLNRTYPQQSSKWAWLEAQLLHDRLKSVVHDKKRKGTPKRM